MAASSSAKPVQKGKGLTQEQLGNAFNELRQQQRQFIAKISEITDERKEYQLVIDTLQEVDKDRKCHRMIGGVLVERTVGEVLPALITNVAQMKTLLEELEKQVEAKGKELQDFKETHGIRVQGEGPSPSAQEKDDQPEAKSTGVLVSGP